MRGEGALASLETASGPPAVPSAIQFIQRQRHLFPHIHIPVGRFTSHHHRDASPPPFGPRRLVPFFAGGKVDRSCSNGKASHHVALALDCNETAESESVGAEISHQRTLDELALSRPLCNLASFSPCHGSASPASSPSHFQGELRPWSRATAP